jgi:ATP-binding cassette subfamily A (ABC1) protein 3
MKLMGMKVWLHWLAWFIKCAIMMIVSVGFMTFFFHIKVDGRAIITYTHPSVTFVFLLLYSLSIITFSFAVSTFFSKGQLSPIFVNLFMNVFSLRHKEK